MGGIQKDQTGKQNGNMPEYTSEKRIIGEGDDPNGNALDATDNTSLHTGKKQDGKALDLDQQYDRVQVSTSVFMYLLWKTFHTLVKQKYTSAYKSVIITGKKILY